MRVNELSERSSGLFKTRLSLTRIAPIFGDRAAKFLLVQMLCLYDFIASYRSHASSGTVGMLFKKLLFFLWIHIVLRYMKPKPHENKYSTERIFLNFNFFYGWEVQAIYSIFHRTR